MSIPILWSVDNNIMEFIKETWKADIWTNKLFLQV